MSKIVKVDFRKKREHRVLEQYFESARVFTNCRGKLSDTYLYDRIVEAKKRRWDYIMYYGLLVRDKQTLEEEGCQAIDLGTTFKIILPKDV